MTARDGAREAGFTVIELLMAMMVIVVGLLATMTAFQHGLNGIGTGRAESTATFLVEARLEELKALALVDWTNTALQPGTLTEYCASDSRCSTRPSPASLRRTTAIADGGAACATQCKTVTVSVFYRAITAMGQLDQERRVAASTLYASRP